MSNLHELHILYNRHEIEAAVKSLAGHISKDYRDKSPLFIGILKGSFIFMADLVRFLEFPVEVDFIRLSSYGRGTRSSGKVEVVQGLRSEITGRDVLIVEDIVDTGITISFLLDYLQKKQPASLRLCTLMDKPSQRQVPVNIDYLGLTVPDKFLVGYGLDWNEKFRNLPDICVIEEES